MSETTAALVLIESTHDTLTVSWVETSPPYTLQYRKVNEEEYTTLSESLTAPMARKRNLDGEGFIFRAKSSSSLTWMTHSEPFHLLKEGAQQMEAPKVYVGGSHSSLRVVWTSSSGAAPYEIQMREVKPGVPWSTIAQQVQGTQVRKRNLTSSNGYQFRVRTAGMEYSPASDTVVALGLSSGIQRWFHSCNTLLSNNPQQTLTSIPLSEALGGKEFVLLYASAHWCGPCRNFTPRLAQWYAQQRQDGLVEVVFLSADHDEDGFSSYFKSMPWLAVDYDGPREELMAQIKVSGIPRLVVLDGRSGRILVDNAVGQTLDVNAWRKLSLRKH